MPSLFLRGEDDEVPPYNVACLSFGHWMAKRPRNEVVRPPTERGRDRPRRLLEGRTRPIHCRCWSWPHNAKSAVQTDSLFLLSNFALLAHSAQIRFALLPLPEFAFLILIASGERPRLLARSSVQKMRRPSATRKAFVCDFVAGPGLSKVDNNMDRAGRSRCNRKRQFWIVDSCGCMAAAGLATGTSSQSLPWALHAYRVTGMVVEQFLLTKILKLHFSTRCLR